MSNCQSSHTVCVDCKIYKEYSKNKVSVFSLNSILAMSRKYKSVLCSWNLFFEKEYFKSQVLFLVGFRYAQKHREWKAVYNTLQRRKLRHSDLRVCSGSCSASLEELGLSWGVRDHAWCMLSMRYTPASVQTAPVFPFRTIRASSC